MQTDWWFGCVVQYSVLRKKFGMCLYTRFFITDTFRIFLFRLCNCRQWLKYQQSWANHCFQNWWFRAFRYELRDRCERTHDTCWHSTGVPSYPYRQAHILWQTRNIVNKNFQNGNNTLKTTDICHICVLVICIRTYIYKRRVGLKKV